MQFHLANQRKGTIYILYDWCSKIRPRKRLVAASEIRMIWHPAHSEINCEFNGMNQQENCHTLLHTTEMR